MNGGNTPNVKLKIMPDLFLEILQNGKTLKFLDLKRDYKTYTKENSNLKLSQSLTTYKINSIY